MARFAVGHSREVAARHYADLPSLRPLHEAAVADAFRAAVAAAMPTIPPPTAEQPLRGAPESAGPLLPPDTDGPVLDADRDFRLERKHAPQGKSVRVHVDLGRTRSS